MDISLSDVGKKYRNNYVFRHLSLSIPAGSKTAIVGHNGSGKSTLLKLISSSLTHTEGTIKYEDASLPIEISEVPERIAYCAPYIDLIPSLSVKEMVDFHFKFASPRASAIQLFEESSIKPAENLLVSELSSGMHQRLKLILALASNVDVILLDEPTTNLDDEGKNWLTALLEKELDNRTLIVASNEDRDIALCDTRIDVMEFK